MTVDLEGAGVTVADVVAVARRGEEARVSDGALSRMAASRRIVESLADGEPAYGISTGFGALANTTIPADRRAALQQSLIRSHAAGMGPAVEPEVVRAMMFLRARTLAFGASGARPQVAESLVRLINAGVVPVVPEHGSLGASGDLAPLAHAALVLIGEGEVLTDDGAIDAAEALARAGIEPLQLAEKEGLALTNGTDGILGMLCLAAHDAKHLLAVADIVAACSVEALLATDRAFAADLLALRPHPGQQASAANLRAVLAGSPIVASHRHGDDRVQDAYSIRCTPQVHGAARDTLEFVIAVTDRELASAIDNPMVLPDGRVESCGNFHGAPVALAADYLAIAAAEVGAIAERRIDRLLDPGRSQGLPPFLAEEAGGGQRPDDRPIHRGCSVRREPAPGRPGRGGLAAHLGHAGGPRVDGLGRGPQAAPGHRQPAPHPGRRMGHRRSRHRAASTPAARGGHRRSCQPAAQESARPWA